MCIYPSTLLWPLCSTYSRSCVWSSYPYTTWRVFGCWTHQYGARGSYQASGRYKKRVTFNTQLLQDIARQNKRNVNKDEIQLPCDLPLNTYKDILAVEQNLKSKEFYSQLVWLYFIYFSVIADLLILCHYFVLHYITGHSQIMQHRIKVSRSLVKVRGISLFIWWQAPL